MLIKSSMHKKQTGAVLVTALVLMAVLTIIGITSMRGNMMDFNIHKAMKSRSNAFQCAEAALRAGELWIDNLARAPDSTSVLMTVPNQNTYQLWNSRSTVLANMEIRDSAWWVVNGWTYGTNLINANNNIGCLSQPRYIIEYIGTVDGGSKSLEFASEDLIDFFRITGRSVGISDTAAVVLQTTYAKRLR
jgi:type IV pilus assembly protein PilX